MVTLRQALEKKLTKKEREKLISSYDVLGSIAIIEIPPELEKKEKFGYFVSLAPGITGLLPKSKISGAEKPGLIEQLKVGDSIVVAVEGIHPSERKITLAPGDPKDEGAWKNFAQVETPLAKGDLAFKLQQAMGSKNNK